MNGQKEWKKGGSEGENFKRSVSGEWYDEGFIKDR